MGNSNNSRKNCSKYLLLNIVVNQYVMNVKAEKKPRLTSIPIMLRDEDEVRVNYPHGDALAITWEIDTKSSTDIIFK